MSGFWTKIDLNDRSTYQPIGKEILWNSYWKSIDKRHIMMAHAYTNEWGVSVDGTSLKEGDCWAEIPEIE